MMMFDMHPDTAKHFYKEACPTGREMTKKTGIAELVPGAVVDDFAFDPCGCVHVEHVCENEKILRGSTVDGRYTSCFPCCAFADKL